METGKDNKAAVEQRIVKLKVLKAKTHKIVIALADLYTCPKPEKLKALTSAMKTVESLRAEKVVGARKVIDACMNELTSLREGIFVGAVSKKKDMELITCTEAISKFQALLEAAVKRQERIAAEENPQDIVAADGIDLAQLNIIKNLKEKDKLPKIKGKAFVVGRAPVVVVTNAGGIYRKGAASSFVNRSTLEKEGFKVDMVDGYAIVHNQLVIGVNKSMIEGYDKGKPVETVQVVAKRIVAALSKASKKKLTFVSDALYGYEQGSWFWVMSQAELNQFSKAFPGGHPTLPEWGFAFGELAKQHLKGPAAKSVDEPYRRTGVKDYAFQRDAQE